MLCQPSKLDSRPTSKLLISRFMSFVIIFTLSFYKIFMMMPDMLRLLFSIDSTMFARTPAHIAYPPTWDELFLGFYVCFRFYCCSFIICHESERDGNNRESLDLHTKRCRKEFDSPFSLRLQISLISIRLFDSTLISSESFVDLVCDICKVFPCSKFVMFRRRSNRCQN